jgi:dCMP deaminase
MFHKTHKDFLTLAKFWAELKSKDPSTKVAAVIADDKKRIVGMGYNGFPRGVEDNPERYHDREIKYKYVVHAEVNAILNAVKSVEGCTLYCYPLPTCSECAKVIIQSGIKRVVFPKDSNVDKNWTESFNFAYQMYSEAGVEVLYV